MHTYFQKWFFKVKWLRKHPFIKTKNCHFSLKELSQLNRHTVAGGVAIGLFINFLPLPLQAIWASLLCLYFKTNLPIAVALTWINNPFTFIPINYFLYQVGLFILDEKPQLFPFLEFKFSLDHLMLFLEQFLSWAFTLGKPYILGVFIVSIASGALGYLLTSLLWELSQRLKKDLIKY
ncbi:MAG: DUF2062 domain-containing protein [Candidatus Paracaedimonas acanthamoebae]|uniref:DUF2062 domain-containing protein n=1 Tax=Candidatus Paracaedimonas acanthamoebae TaxID=244581 RepID=A0A8J7PTG5_9PROT|nr:DUF2062 domain-containing protein [Candidatus Paracaedimonas acanthamoebae]